MTRVTRMKAVQWAAPCERPRSSSIGERSSANADAPKAAERNPASVTPICTAARKRLGSVVQLGDLRAPPAARGQRLDLALPQRDQGDLGSGEEGPDEQEGKDDRRVGDGGVHGVPPAGPAHGRSASRHACLQQPSMLASVRDGRKAPRRPTPSTGSALGRTQGQAGDEMTLQDEEDDQRGQHDDDGSGRNQVVVGEELAAKVVQRAGDRDTCRRSTSAPSPRRTRCRPR